MEKTNRFGRNGCEYRLCVPGLEITRHPEVLFSQVFMIWECSWSPVSWVGNDTMHTAHGNAVCVTTGRTFGVGCKLKQKKYFWSHSKGPMWMDMICMFWTTAYKASIHKICSCSHNSHGKNSTDFIAVGARNNSFFLRTMRIISKYALKLI